MISLREEYFKKLLLIRSIWEARDGGSWPLSKIINVLIDRELEKYSDDEIKEILMKRVQELKKQKNNFFTQQQFRS